MRRSPTRSIAGRLLAALAAAALLHAASGCTYLKSRREKSVQRQLDPRARAVATSLSGYEDTDVGILSDKAALEELSRLLDVTCFAPEAKP